MLISHASPPSWYKGEIPGHFITPEDERRNLGLDAEGWEVVRAELITRDIFSADGAPATIDDCLIVALRTS